MKGEHKNRIEKDIVWGTALGVGSFLVFGLMYSLVAPYAFSYIEQMGIAIWCRQLIEPMLWQPGGVDNVISLAVVQLFAVPWVSIVVASGVLAIISWLLGLYLHKVTGAWALSPLGIIPVLALGFLLLNVDFHFSAAIAFLLMSLALMGQIGVPDGYWRLGVAIVLSIVLYLLAGPIALLYGCIVFVQQILKKNGSVMQGLCYISCVVIVVAMAYYYIAVGNVSDWQHALLPMGYFTLRLQGGNILIMPWIWTLIIVIIACVGRYIKISVKYAYLTSVLSIVFAVWGSLALTDRNNEVFKQLNFLARVGEWSRIEALCERQPMNNLLFQNFRSMALAEQGKLGDKLFEKPALDIRTIYPIGEKSPYIYMLLSDIYYSMGHISLAQRYAFEANESLGNTSPRMLQRLVDTNIITGQYAVAAKYLLMLENTLMYKDWAVERRTLLSDSAVSQNAELAIKRNCLFADNRFAGVKGLDDDLAQICRANPKHEATVQYLGSLYLLSKDIPKFQTVIDSLWNKEKALPEHYQEALIMLPDSVVANYELDQSVKDRFLQFTNNPKTQPNTFWYFWKYVR